MSNKKPKFSSAMFDSIEAALNKKSDGGGSFANVLKTPAGHTYTVRLVPNVEDPSKTFFTHTTHGWNSKATGKFVNFLSLQTVGQRDPIGEFRWKLFQAWKNENPTADNKDYNGIISQVEKHFVNVYVIDDPNNPENNGKVKILSAGSQIKKKIDDALKGDRAEELGIDIFDLTKGLDLKIKAEANGKTGNSKYTNFSDSFFTTRSKTVITEEQADEIHGQIHDLEQVYPVRTYEELVTALNEHFFVGDAVDERKPLNLHQEKSVDKSPFKDEEDEIPMKHDGDVKREKAEKQPAKGKDTPSTKFDDSEIDDILSNLP